jgi:cell division protein FtsB
VKPVLGQAVRYLEIPVVFVVLVCVLFLIAENGVAHRRKLEEKKAALAREFQDLQVDIRTLERRLKLLRTDPGSIEKVAKCKLGMARRDETVYIFDRSNLNSSKATSSSGLDNRVKHR